MRFIRVAAVACALFAIFGSIPSRAQSTPGLSYGQVPTAGQWNSYFAMKQDFLNFTPLNVAGGTMQGELRTAPSTGNNASLNVALGVNPTMPVNGDMWMTSGGLFARINGVTQQVASPTQTWRGPWVNSTSYNVGDLVSNNGSSWIAISANVGSEPSPSNSQWNVFTEFPGLTGEVTAPSGSSVTTISDGAVTAAKIAFGAVGSSNLQSSLSLMTPVLAANPASTANDTEITTTAWTKQFFPGLTTNVAPTGTAGLNEGQWMIKQDLTSPPSTLNTATLRVQKSSSYSGYTGQDNAIWALCTDNQTSAAFGWCGLFQLENSGVGQDVALQATTEQLNDAGPAWATNFTFNEITFTSDPVNPHLTTESDMFASGTDANLARFNLQFALAGPGNNMCFTGKPCFPGCTPGVCVVGVHATAAMLFNPADGAVYDNLSYIKASGSGSFGNGFNFTTGTFAGPVIDMAVGQAIAFDGTPGSTIGFNRSLYWNGDFKFKTQNGDVVFIDDNGLITSSGGFHGPIATWADNQTCNAGQIIWDANFIYVCTATNTVKRAALSAF